MNHKQENKKDSQNEPHTRSQDESKFYDGKFLNTIWSNRMPPNVTKLVKQETAEVLHTVRPLLASPFNPNPKNLNQSEKALNPSRKDLDHDTI